MTNNYCDFIKTEYYNLSLKGALQKSPIVLLGVTNEAENVLRTLEIETVFDLAMSRVFNNAAFISNAATNFANPMNKFGMPPDDMVDQIQTRDKKIDELRFESIALLQEIGIALEAQVEQALNVKTIRDLALYQPFLSATAILSKAFFPEREPDYDPESPADLVPKSGEYPTEKVQYHTLLIDEIQNGQPLIDISSGNFSAIDISTLGDNDTGFNKIASGALLTFQQAWYVQGVTLGQLLHSAALAPGESTRIAVIDWSRRTKGSQTEDISETEDLTNDTIHNRAISEVTQAVASEAQGGFSASTSAADSSQAGSSSGSSIKKF
jgi:hypothetical protein